MNCTVLLPLLAADWLYGQSGGETQVTETASVPEAAPTLEEVRTVLADASRKGHTAEIRSLLQKYGGKKLSEIDPINYKALLADVGVLSNAP